MHKSAQAGCCVKAAPHLTNLAFIWLLWWLGRLQVFGLSVRGTQQGLGVAVLCCARAVSSHLLPGAGMLCHAAVPKDADVVQANGAGWQGKSYEVENEGERAFTCITANLH